MQAEQMLCHMELARPKRNAAKMASLNGRESERSATEFLMTPGTPGTILADTLQTRQAAAGPGSDTLTPDDT
jgi:hypothetical protein